MRKWKGRRVVSFVMTLVMVVSTLSGCGKSVATENDTANQIGSSEEAVYLTRGQWIEGLARSFGMAEYLSEEPYFTDVSKENELFPYVQAVGDLGAYEETGTAFEAEEYVTREFAVATAVIAADVLESTGYVTADEEGMPDYDVCIQFAFDNGNIEKTDEEFLAETITVGEGQLILEWVMYAFEHPVINEKEEVVLQEGVADFSEKTAGITVSGDTVTVEAALGSNLKVGDVFLTPATEEIPWAVAKKVVSVTTDAAGNQVVTTEQPELIEVFSSIDIEQIAMPDLSYIVPAEGVTIAETSDTVGAAEHMQLASNNGMKHAGGFTYNSDGDKIIDYNFYGEKFEHEDVTFNIAIGYKEGYGLSLGTAYETSRANVTAMVKDIKNKQVQEDFKDLVENVGAVYSGKTLAELDVKKEKMYEKGHSLKGKITLRDLYASVDIDMDKFLDVVAYDVNTLGLTINYVADLELEYEGEFSGELYIGHIFFPIGGICAVAADVFVYMDANGVVQLEIRTGTNTSYRYKENQPIRYATRDYSQPWLEDTKAIIDGEVGAGVRPYVSVAGMSVFEVGIKSGANLSFNIEVEKETSEPKEMENETASVTESKYLAVTGTVYWPVITIDSKLDVVFSEVEKEAQLVGPEGRFESVVAWEFYNKRLLIHEQEYIINSDGSKVKGVNTDMLNALLYAPEKNEVGSISYDNFYKREGAEAFVNNLQFIDNPDDLETLQQYRPGTNISYMEGDIDFGDGSLLTGGANLLFETQDEEISYRNGTSLLYDSTDLLKVDTNRMEIAENNPAIRGNVGGFMDFLAEYKCYHVSDFVQLLQLTQGFYDNMNEDSAHYQEKLQVGSYGEVTFTLSSWKDFNGYVQKQLFIGFAEDSGSPYQEIVITEGVLNNFTEWLPYLSVSALTPAYFTTEDWPDRDY